MADNVAHYEQSSEPTMIVFFGDHQPPLKNAFYEKLYGKPLSERILGDQGLTAALRGRNIEAFGLGAGKAGEDWLDAGYTLPAGWPSEYDLVVIQGGDVPAPESLPGSRLLFLAPEPEEASALPVWAEAMAAAGLRRDFGWKSWGALAGAALFCPAAGEARDLTAAYEEKLDSLRIKLDRAEQSCRDYQKLTDHQRSELSAAHEHENQLETALNNVTGSTCWKITWPVRYLLSKLRQLCTSFRRCKGKVKSMWGRGKTNVLFL